MGRAQTTVGPDVPKDVVLGDIGGCGARGQVFEGDVEMLDCGTARIELFEDHEDVHVIMIRGGHEETCFGEAAEFGVGVEFELEATAIGASSFGIIACCLDRVDGLFGELVG